jgi:hypothetical protein
VLLLLLGGCVHVVGLVLCESCERAGTDAGSCCVAEWAMWGCNAPTQQQNAGIVP